MIKLKYPVKYIAITSGYRPGNRPNHTGIDLGWNRNYGGENVPVYAPANGKVIEVVNGKDNNLNNPNDSGNLIKIQHEDGLTTRFIHLLKGSIIVKKGDIVLKDEKIAITNNSGYSKGTHLHYEVWLNGIKVNPVFYTYYHDDQIVHKDTLENYKLKKYIEEIPENDLRLYDKVLPIQLINWQGTSLIQYDDIYYITKIEKERSTLVLSALRGKEYKVWARLNYNNVKKIS